MADIRKIISANDINEGSSIVGVSRGGTTADIIKLEYDFNDQLSIGAIESGYDNRFDDYGLRRKTIEIGDWNMDSTSSLEVSHGLSGDNWKGMRSIELSIRNDADTAYYDADQFSGNVSVSGIDSTSITLERAAATASPSGFFDHPNFDATGFNRGWATVWYE